MDEDLTRLARLANTAISDGNSKVAAAFLNQIHKKLPKGVEAAVRCIEVWLNTGDVLVADALAGQATDTWSEDGALLKASKRAFVAASAFHRKTAQQADTDEDADLALRHWNALLAREPDHPWAKNYQTIAFGLSSGFYEKLCAMDGEHPRTRIYLAGCGRSGTWMLSSMMQCFENTITGEQEMHLGAFANFKHPHLVHVLKRMHNSHQYLHRIPEEIGLIYIVRNPFDVLTSKHLNADFFITPSAWEAEMQGFRRLMEMKRKNFMTIRYEDLVLEPDQAQLKIANKFSLTCAAPFSEFHLHARQSDVIADSMHGLRAPSGSSIQRYRNDPEKLVYVKKVSQILAKPLQWVCNTFGYDQTP